MLLPTLATIFGFILLIGSAGQFIRGASKVARYFGLSPLLIGITLVALGTSLPEMLVSLMAAIQGNPDLAIGNAIGSNITNIGLVLGVTAIVVPLQVHSKLLRREFPILCFIMVVSFIVLYDGQLSRLDGVILLIGLIVLVSWLVRLGITQYHQHDAIEAEYEEALQADMSLTLALFWLISGLVLLPISSRMTVWGAAHIAHQLGVSDFVVGLTGIAIGTSLPELAASLISALKNEHDIAIGNVIGSNMFNLLGVLGLPALIHPSTLPDRLLSRDFFAMTLLTGAFFMMAYWLHKPGRISRPEGVLLLLGFFSYLGLLLTTM